MIAAARTSSRITESRRRDSISLTPSRVGRRGLGLGALAAVLAFLAGHAHRHRAPGSRSSDVRRAPPRSPRVRGTFGSTAGSVLLTRPPMLRRSPVRRRSPGRSRRARRRPRRPPCLTRRGAAVVEHRDPSVVCSVSGGPSWPVGRASRQMSCRTSDATVHDPVHARITYSVIAAFAAANAAWR